MPHPVESQYGPHAGAPYDLGSSIFQPADRSTSVNAVFCEHGGSISAHLDRGTAEENCAAVGTSPGDTAAAFISRDGGSTWSRAHLPVGIAGISGMYCASVVTCIAVSRGAILRSTNFGATWQPVADPTPGAELRSVSCTSTTVCIIAGYYNGTAMGTMGVILVSRSSGLSWGIASIPRWMPGLAAVGCSSSGFCITAGYMILVTEDAGSSWQFRSASHNLAATVASISCVKPTTCYALGPGVASQRGHTIIFFTTNGGATFEALPILHGPANASTIACVAEQSCDAAASPIAAHGSSPENTGTFLSTTDGGATWNTHALPAQIRAVSSLQCASHTTCVLTGAGGAGGVIAATTDAGRSWSITTLR